MNAGHSSAVSDERLGALNCVNLKRGSLIIVVLHRLRSIVLPVPILVTQFKPSTRLYNPATNAHDTTASF